MMTATSASHRTDNSLAFLINPFLLLEKVTCLLFKFSIFLISIFPLPMFFSLPSQKAPTFIILPHQTLNPPAFRIRGERWAWKEGPQNRFFIYMQDTQHTQNKKAQLFCCWRGLGFCRDHQKWKEWPKLESWKKSDRWITMCGNDPNMGYYLLGE